jgi:hypothetical protein
MSPIWTSESLRKLLGDVDDAQLAAILALNPSAAEVEMALARLNSADTEPAEGWPVQGKAVDIVDILSSDEDEDR